MADDRVLASDINSYYSRLNNIRSKFGLGAVGVPSIVSMQTNVLSEQIKTYDDKMTETANSRSQYISKNLSTGDLSQGAVTKRSTDVNIKQMLTTWESTCYHRSDYSDRSNDGDYGDRSDDTINNNHENERFSDGTYRAVCASVYEYKTDG